MAEGARPVRKFTPEAKAEGLHAQHPIPTDLSFVTPAFLLGYGKPTEPTDTTSVDGGRVSVRTYTYWGNEEGKGSVRGSVQLRLDATLPEEQQRAIREELISHLSPSGLKVLGVVMLNCYENNCQPYFVLDVNNVLDQLGYKRDKRGQHYSRNRKRVSETLVRLSRDVKFCIEKRQPKNVKKDMVLEIRGPIFSIEAELAAHEVGAGQQVSESTVLRSGVVIRVNVDLYRNLETGTFTWQQDRLYMMDVSTHGHPFAFTLAWYFNTQWSLGYSQYHGTIRQPLRQILARSGILMKLPKRKSLRRRFLERIEQEFVYLVQEGHAKSIGPVEDQPRRDPLDVMYKVVIPDHHELKLRLKGPDADKETR